MAKDETHDVNDIEMIEEAYDRVEVLVKLLVQKGILQKGEYESKLEAFLDTKYND